MKIYALVVGLLLVAAPALAADVDGKWTGTFSTPNGDIEVGYTFKADGMTLTGTTTGPDGTATPIKNGKIDGNNITFVVELDLNGMPFVMNYKGVVQPAQKQIALTLDVMGMPIELVVTKAE